MASVRSCVHPSTFLCRSTPHSHADERFIITAGDVALSRFYSHIVAQQLLQSHYGVRLPAIDTPVADFAAAYHKCKVSISMNDGAAKREEQITPMIGATVSVGA